MTDTNVIANLQTQLDRERHRVTLAEQERDVLEKSHTAIGHHLAETGRELSELRLAVRALLSNVRSRHPGEELTCPHMRKLDELINASLRQPVLTNTPRAA